MGPDEEWAKAPVKLLPQPESESQVAGFFIDTPPVKLKSMTPQEYINLVTDKLKNDDAQQAVRDIIAINKPDNTPPIIDLIHGDSLQLEDDPDLKYNDDYELADEAHVRKVSAEIASEIVVKIKRYVADWSAGNTYKYSFKLSATYGRFKDAHGAIERIEIYKKEPELETVQQAIQAAKEWNSTLLERVIFYADQATGHKRGSVTIVYKITDSHGKLIALGSISGQDAAELVCTWQNNILPQVPLELW